MSAVAGSLDTNVLARLLVRDDEAQTQAAARLLERHARRAEPLWVPVTVVLELEWVLRSRYRFDKAQVLATLSGLLSCVELVFESEHALEQALATYEESSADFGECLHLGLAAQADALPFWTFDVKAAKLRGACGVRA